jgi:hypothetical protein
LLQFDSSCFSYIHDVDQFKNNSHQTLKDRVGAMVFKWVGAMVFKWVGAMVFKGVGAMVFKWVAAMVLNEQGL